jgi:hypothetical protein
MARYVSLQGLAETSTNIGKIQRGRPRRRPEDDNIKTNKVFALCGLMQR